MCTAYSKVTHIKQQKYFHHLKQSNALDTIQSYYIHGPLGDENIFAVLYVSLCLTHCDKTTVFLHLYLQYFDAKARPILSCGVCLSVHHVRDLPCAASLAGIQPVRPRAQRTSP